MITDEQFDLLADKSHFFGAMAAVFGVLAVGAPWGLTDPWWGFGGIFIFAALKEGIWDPCEETEEVSGGIKGGLIDFTGYILGGGTAVILYYVSVLIHHRFAL